MPSKYKQHPLYQNYYVSRKGEYYFIKANGERSSVRKGTLTKNKYGKPLCYEACITIRKGEYTVVNVGRLVLETYVGFAPDDKPEIDHIDRCPLNNDIKNLRWASRSDNCINRTLKPWSDDRQAKRLETARKLGYNTWGELLSAGRKRAKARRQNAEDTINTTCLVNE